MKIRIKRVRYLSLRSLRGMHAFFNRRFGDAAQHFDVLQLASNGHSSWHHYSLQHCIISLHIELPKGGKPKASGWACDASTSNHHWNDQEIAAANNLASVVCVAMINVRPLVKILLQCPFAGGMRVETDFFLLQPDYSTASSDDRRHKGRVFVISLYVYVYYLYKYTLKREKLASIVRVLPRHTHSSTEHTKNGRLTIRTIKSRREHGANVVDTGTALTQRASGSDCSEVNRTQGYQTENISSVSLSSIQKYCRRCDVAHRQTMCALHRYAIHTIAMRSGFVWYICIFIQVANGIQIFIFDAARERQQHCLFPYFPSIFLLRLVVVVFVSEMWRWKEPEKSESLTECLFDRSTLWQYYCFSHFLPVCHRFTSFDRRSFDEKRQIFHRGHTNRQPISLHCHFNLALIAATNCEHTFFRDALFSSGSIFNYPILILFAFGCCNCSLLRWRWW